MKKAILSLIGIIIIPAIQLIILALDWLGIRPSVRSTNFLSKIYAFLFYKISVPVIVIIFLLTIIFIYIYFKVKNKSFKIPAKIDNKVAETKKEDKKEKIELTNDHKFILLWLLNSNNCTAMAKLLEDTYNIKLNKSKADFNILRQELVDEGLIYDDGYYWTLNPKGLNVAKAIHKSIKKIDKTGPA
jgi:predicted membrane protein